MKKNWGACLLALCWSATSAAQMPILSMDYQSSQAKGMRFHVDVNDAGLVRFDGFQLVKGFGHHQYQLTPAQRQALTSLMQSPWLAQIPSELSGTELCKSFKAEMPRIQWQVGAKAIVHDLGCQGFAQQMSLYTWEQQVYQVLALNHWVGSERLHQPVNVQPPVAAFSELLQYLQQQSFAAILELNVGANEAKLKTLSEAIGQPLPTQLARLLGFSNGQSPTSMGLMVDGYYLLSTEEIIFEYQTLSKIYKQSASSRQILDRSGAVLDTWWQPQWIPFASIGNGDLLLIDLSPGEQGDVGQIVEFIHDDTARPLLAKDLQSYFAQIRAGLKSGEFVLTEYGVLRKSDADMLLESAQ
ncbi:hypothetical protein VST7929_01123 [Vibrio stylophorae]|uniref:Knr4/Smi1-like domain-containing protein n=1 Tax=Vibrio stylophorae TaxID=659351 RepID=A0ABN8DQ19_9VIBR|nr:SMI1/KNR4 family protein [Vibrio stylophorae]CAH0533259.1 hypothetical protein VST7929_01123 [Vibrio stylophorae]